MKRALTVVLFLLFTIGVCVDGNEVSVTEGDSVTLKSGVTELKTDDEIEWKFSGTLIATISSDDGEISVWVKADGSFRDRLQLDRQTGDLKISNIRTTDSGEYKLLISSPRGSPPEVTFTVKALPDPGWSSADVAGIVIGLLLAAAVAGVIYYCCKRSKALDNMDMTLDNMDMRTKENEYDSL